MAEQSMDLSFLTDTEHQQCGRCGRKTWSATEFGTEDRMTQPDGFPCGGRFGEPKTTDPLVERLKARRMELNLSQSAMARTLGTTQSAVSEIEAGLTSPTLRTLRKWSAVLSVDIELTAGAHG
jgi:DNA-binding XRE family transcriptional regulator